uniref:Ovule protein n=1 Tax=Ascaris lumbricoides TaxID=6252 RepID=A0A0M3IDV8_ASCLU
MRFRCANWSKTCLLDDQNNNYRITDPSVYIHIIPLCNYVCFMEMILFLLLFLNRISPKCVDM